uniref:NADH-ubiquinone oxidoreductase chain 2 n=1 Tax=Euryusa optabilis TaxID=878090 RepID=A0A0S2M783_9COLE|nr:NADH dehydrogenase subunit 2 [Euryusa optabilis]ALO70553.1 NADH deshydrogenase subunit 2 [Euryusa optabilis]
MFFMLTLMFGSLVSISSNSWIGMWLGLEINLLAFIPIIINNNNSFSSESSLKYFLTQALASIILLFTLILLSSNSLINKNMDSVIFILLNSTLLTKMGMAPFHFWFPEVIEGLNWLNCLILLTWQKITPMILVMYNVCLQYFFFIIILISMLISGIMGINQTSFRKILAYSSINHMAWMISAMFVSNTIWWFYFIVYSILTVNIIFMFYTLKIFYYNQLNTSLNKNFLLKILFSFNFLSLGGLPPFLGFLPKWLTIQNLINSNFFLLTLFMVIMTLTTLFFYMQIIFNLIILNNNEMNYLKLSSLNNIIIIFFNSISIMGLILFSLVYNFS